MSSRVLLLILAALLFSACGGESGSSEEGEGAEAACTAPPKALSGTPQLPSGFPTPTEVTYTESKQAGPSNIVSGYWAGGIEAAYEGYKDAFEGTPYSVTKEEKEEDDAEVNFAGSGASGQVKLLQECKDRTSVSITVRPA